MSKVTTMTRANVKTFSEEAVEALEAVARKYGLSVSYQGGRFSSTDATLKLEFACEAQAGDGSMSGVPADFAKLAPLYGLEAGDFGATFVVGRTSYRITGISPRRRKYPFSGEGPQGGRYKFTEEQVTRGLCRTNAKTA